MDPTKFIDIILLKVILFKLFKINYKINSFKFLIQNYI